ncbi:MAG TPA: transglycosylase family protein [Pseudonocardiaceae bacterium]|nr:transglycosylase family protein [Pseudonocardiaceae bacterium]
MTVHLRRTLTVALTALALPVAITLTATPAGADPTAGAWAQLRNCESGDNYTIVAVNGHYGAYQFDLTTWRSVGGTGKPNQATPTEQDYRALYLYRMRGWQPWTCAHMLGLRPDRDAASKRKPTYAQSAYIGRNPTTTTTMPPWPGKVYSYGDCDPALRTWQLRMNAYHLGFDGTGCYYAKTKSAVLAVQRANHIKASGLLGPKTWRAAWQGKAP